MNRLTITGEEHERMAEVWRAGHVLSRLVPEPDTYSSEELAQLQRVAWVKLSTDNAWYWWRTLNWGTTRDATDVVVAAASDDATVIHFDTAWSRPIAGLHTMSGLYPDLLFTLKCFEPNLPYAAHAVFQAGKIISNEYYNDGEEYRRIATEFGWEVEE
jgi:hypothetical protein